jgi:hypothetical protein
MGVLLMNVTSDDYSDWYKLVDNPKNSTDAEWCIELIKSEWSGIIYKYCEYKFHPESKKVNFGYDVLYVPSWISGVDYPDEYQKKFDKLLGDVLVDIVSKSIDNNLKERVDAKLGNTDSEDTDVRRVVYKESNPFLKI